MTSSLSDSLGRQQRRQQQHDAEAALPLDEKPPSSPRPPHRFDGDDGDECGTASSSSSYASSSHFPDYEPRHSDYTVQISNRRRRFDDEHTSPPPPPLQQRFRVDPLRPDDSSGGGGSSSRRSIFPEVQRRYGAVQHQPRSSSGGTAVRPRPTHSHLHDRHDDDDGLEVFDGGAGSGGPHWSTATGDEDGARDLLPAEEPPSSAVGRHHLRTHLETNGRGTAAMGQGTKKRDGDRSGATACCRRSNGGRGNNGHGSGRRRRRRPHETVHAQSLLLGLAFAAVWSPSNLMAPNLTEMALDFSLETEEERDLYLGSYCALAVSVLSLPVAAALGIATDLVPARRWLFAGCCAGGAAASLATSRCRTVRQLMLCRLINGGFMSGSVPVAFSVLGDWFSTAERNAASSGLTACMGLGIIAGQVYAGMAASGTSWRHSFAVSAAVTAAAAAACALMAQEPVRGGREEVLQGMMRAGTAYERKLTAESFWHAVRHNASNATLLWQGFTSSLPWGVIFVFLNDYLSQERGFSVPDATFLVAVFGAGCAVGGIAGGVAGQWLLRRDRRYLPLFMAVTTAAGIAPFMGLLNSATVTARGWYGVSCSFMGGMVASLPSVNVRPCLLNVNPPESRGASLTAANLLIQLGRGVGPSCITLLQFLFHADRKFAFNVTLISFWLIAAIQLLFLVKTLPRDQDAMEAELASYAAEAIHRRQRSGDALLLSVVSEDETQVSIEERLHSFDGKAAKDTLVYLTEGIRELGSPLFRCSGVIEISSSSNSSQAGDDEPPPDFPALDSPTPTGGRRELWLAQEQEDLSPIPHFDDVATESTPLIV